MILRARALDERPDLAVREMPYDGPLGRWTEAVCPPPPALAPFVEMLWSSEGELAAGLRRERILPRPGYELMLNLSIPNALYEDGDPARPLRYESAWVSGLHEGPLLVGFPRRVHVVGARLKPEGALALLGGPLSELAGRVPFLDHVLGPDALALRERMGEARDARERFGWLVAVLEERIARGPRADARVARGVQLLRASGGRMRIGELGRRVGLSPRHLIARFEAEVGLAPKAFARMTRFHTALRRLESAREVRWAELALACGWSDQAHMVRDFRVFAGATPGEFLRLRAPGGESMLDEALEGKDLQSAPVARS